MVSITVVKMYLYHKLNREIRVIWTNLANAPGITSTRRRGGGSEW